MQQEASLKPVYLRQVKKHLTCSPKERNRFLHRTEQMLDAFLEENPDATEEDLYLALGSPEELAEQMMEECESHQVMYSSKKQSHIVSIVEILLVVVFVWIFSFNLWNFFTDGYIKTNIKEYVIVESYPTPYIP